jgi:hypothetical protein
MVFVLFGYQNTKIMLKENNKSMVSLVIRASSNCQLLGEIYVVIITL